MSPKSSSHPHADQEEHLNLPVVCKDTLIMVYNAQLITPNFGSLDFLEKFLRPGLDF